MIRKILSLLVILLIFISIFAFQVQKAFAIETAWGSTLLLSSGSGTFESVSAANPTIYVSPGQLLSGTVTLIANNNIPPNCVVPLIGTSSWGENSNSWWLIHPCLPYGSSTQTASVNLQAPSEAGTYYIIFAFRGELTGAQMASATNWNVGYLVWNDGNDIADFSSTQISEAQQNGVTVVNWLYAEGYLLTYTPACAITVIVSGTPVHDVAVTGVVASQSQVTVGDSLHVSVFVDNFGTETETFSVTAYRGGGKIGFDTETVTLVAGETRTLDMVWDTTGVEPNTYQIGAYASQVPGETNLANNDYVDGMVLVLEALPTTYNVFFEQSGISNPAQVWGVTLDGYGTQYSNGPGNTIYTVVFAGVANGGPYQFVVTPPSAFVAQPTSGTITVNGGDFHQQITFNPEPTTCTFTLTAGSGGSVSYSFSLGSGTVLSGQSQQLIVPQNCQFSLTANPDSTHVFQTWSTTGSVAVANPSSASTTATVNGNGGVTANFAYSLGVSISPTSTSIKLGQSVAFTATPSGGSGGYTYVWYWTQYGVTPPNHGSQNTGTSNTYTFTPSNAGDYGIYVIVTDSGGKSAQSLSSSVAVTDFQLIVSPQSQTVPITQNIKFRIQVIPLNGFKGSVTFSTANWPNGFTDPVFSPITIQESQESTLSFASDRDAQTEKTYSFDVIATCGQLVHHQIVTLYLTKTVGVKNTIYISDMNDEGGTFSIQQNFVLYVPSTNIQAHAYWVQNVILFQKISGQYKVASGFQIFEYTNFNGPYGPKWANPWPPGLIYSNILQGPTVSFPATFTFTSVVSESQLTLTNDLTSWSWQVPNEDGQQPEEAFILSLYLPDSIPTTKSPEFVLVGPPGRGSVNFSPQASGSVQSFAKLTNQPWSSSVVQNRATESEIMSGESSYNLQWNIVDSNTVSFSYVSGAEIQGIFYMPLGFTTLLDGTTVADQTHLTGVSVSIAGSSAPDGTSVTIATATLSGVPTGVIQVGTIPAAYYDVNVQGINDGIATIYITNNAVTSQTTMQYWNGAQWIQATDVVVSGNTIRGNIPVSALTGTIIAIGPLSSPPPSVTISPLSASILNSQSVTFTSTVSGGIAPYSFQWFLNGNPVSGATSNTWTFTPTSSGIYYVYLKVTDAIGNTKQSETARITVATVPVGGYSIPIPGQATEKLITPYLILTAFLTIAYTTIKRKTTRKPKKT